MEKNDIDMFKLADESYAVQNAHDQLKKNMLLRLSHQMMRTVLPNGLNKTIIGHNYDVCLYCGSI